MGEPRGRRIRLGVTACFVAAASLGAAAGGPAPPAGADADRLDMFRLRAGAPLVERLVRHGYDVAATRAAPGGLEADLVLSPAEHARLTEQGLPLTRWRSADGRTVLDLVRQAASRGYTVWRSYDEPGGLREEMEELARTHPDLVQLKEIGRSGEGRPILALRVTAGAPDVADGSRPAVLHLSLQHAREWISGEVNRRLLRSYVEGYGTDPQVTALVDSRELWFVPVANPDGYERTFDGDRLWRKTTRDNNGDGRVTLADGVDLNRNFPDHWGFDPEGSSDRGDSQSYRGPAEASEPETQAIVGLMGRIPFRFLVNYHSYGRLLLYPFGWQEQTPAADQPIYGALAGTPTNPAIPGYDPQLSTELYVTNGETTSWAHAATGTLGFTPELGEGLPGSGFLFPDNEALIRQEYEINRPFALDLARSAAHPSLPRSHLGHTTPAMVVDTFDVSYGPAQPVQATVARRLGDVVLRFRINGGTTATAPAAEWDGGVRYGGAGDVHYRVVRGVATGAVAGDRVEAWFE
ncbi:MAG TPA: M14 family metallopeptidase, partial [Acidimicrobiia bacterium]|nr:M14 family metallopeptidase [Acidimicrobiia bacterium]